MPRIAFTGLSGELGSFLLQHLRFLPDAVVDFYRAQPAVSPLISEHAPFNLLDPAELTQTLEVAQPTTLIHLAGATHIDACESDRVNGKAGKVWQANVTATARIAQYCAEHDVHLIYLSTECIFNGQKESFLESDQPDPINWYGVTKAAAEQAILASGCRATILRAVIAYALQGRHTLWQKVAQSLATQTELTMADDHWMTPTYLPDIATALDLCLKNQITGRYHLAPSTALSPFTFAQKIAATLGYSEKMVIPKKLEEIIGSEKAKLRLKHACLNSAQTQATLGLTFTTLDAVIKKL